MDFSSGELEHCPVPDHLATTSKAFEPYLTAAIKRGRGQVARELAVLIGQAGWGLANQTGASRNHEEFHPEGLPAFPVFRSRTLLKSF